MTTAIDFRPDKARAVYMQFVQSISCMSSTVLHGTKWRIDFFAHAKALGWTIKSASKERALIDVVGHAQKVGYVVQAGSTVAQALVVARRKEAAKAARRKAKALV